MRIIVVLSAVVATAFSAQIGDTCTNNDQCVVGGAPSSGYCRIASPTCGGICECATPFSYLAQENACRQIAKVGGSCDNNEQCGDKHAACVNDRCACLAPYETGPRGDDCVHSKANKRFGEQCYDSVECYYNAKCRNNKCNCEPGMKQSGEFDCVNKEPGDSCQSPADCQKTPFSQCVAGTCQCQTGEAVWYSYHGKNKKACLPPGSSGPAGEGEKCSPKPTYGTLPVCNKQFECKPCGKGEPVCQRKNAPRSASSGAIVASSVAVMAVAMAL